MRSLGTAGAGVLVIVVGLSAAACSGATVPSAHGSTVVATFDAAETASAPELVDDAHELTTRLRSYGDTNATASVHGHAVVVSGTTGLAVAGSLLVAPGTFQIRPVLCQAAPSLRPTTAAAAVTVPPGCSSPRYSLQLPNLTVNPVTGGSNIASIAPDPVLAPYPSSSAAYDDSHPDSSVLVPESGGVGVRYLLGPTALNATAVAHAHATFVYGQWLVDIRFTEVGASAWDAVAEKYFHELLAFDVDGVAVSAPLMQPAQSTFTSFDGKMQLSGNFTKRSAEQLAAILTSGPLTVALSS